jgi:ribonuclease P protein component
VLPAANRMRRTDEFRNTVRRGLRVGRPLVVVHVLPSANSGDAARVGFVVGRTVGGSVVRNAVRRRLRHLMRDRLVSLPVGSHLVVRAQPAAATVSSAVLARELDDALSRAFRQDVP